MAGIAGLVRFDGQSVSPPDADALRRLLAHRGAAAAVTLPNGMLFAFGGQPETDPTASLRAVADAAVFDPQPAQPFTTAYRHRGPTGFDGLNAEFALALWDEPQQTLACARDPMGVKPLYYRHEPGRFFAFASEIKALLALNEIPTRPNLHKLHEYLTWDTNYLPYSAETFYENVFSLLPGHGLRVDAQGLDVQPYWTLNLDRFAGLRRPDDFAAAFRETFTQAVESRVRGANRPGAHLSGGLDSSSVSGVGQVLLSGQSRPPLRLRTFYIDTGLPAADESAYVRAVVERHGTRHQAVRPVADVLQAATDLLRCFDRPDHFIIPSAFHQSVSLEAQRQGCDVLLTGHDGDSVIPNGFDWLDRLLDAQDWETLRDACRQVASRPDRVLRYVGDDWPRWPEETRFQQYALFLLGTKLKTWFRETPPTQFLGLLRDQRRAFGLRFDAVLAFAYRRLRRKLAGQALVASVLSEDFRRQVPRRAEATTEPLATRWSAGSQFPVKQVINTTNVICNEQLNHLGAAHGHEYAFPFFDRNVIALGLATPLSVHFDEGRGRGLIRRGLADVLPPAVANRFTKANFVGYGTEAAQQLHRATQDRFAATHHPVWDVLDRNAFARVADFVFDPRVPVVQKTRHNWLLSRGIHLGLWLDTLRR